MKQTLGVVYLSFSYIFTIFEGIYAVLIENLKKGNVCIFPLSFISEKHSATYTVYTPMLSHPH